MKKMNLRKIIYHLLKIKFGKLKEVIPGKVVFLIIV